MRYGLDSPTWWLIFFLGVFLSLNLISCTAGEFPAAPPAETVPPKASTTPTKVLPTRSPESSLTPSPTLTPSPQPETPQNYCTATAGTVAAQQFDSEYLDSPLKFYIYLPPCYPQDEQRYPVIYLIHGQTYSNTHWLDLGVADLADRLISEGESVPFIMVFPYDGQHFDPPPVNGFDESVLNELIPAIDGEYRTRAERVYRAIGGISRGGNWAVHLGLQYPGLFGAVGAHSTPVFSSDSNKEIRGWLDSIPLAEFPRLYLDAGTNDRWLQYTLVFENLLSEANVPYEWHLYPGFHDDDYWQAHLDEYLRWYTREW